MAVPRLVHFDRLAAEGFGLNAIGFTWDNQVVNGVALVTRWLATGPWDACYDPVSTTWTACYTPVTTTWTECP